jgi:hypothetical protein
VYIVLRWREPDVQSKEKLERGWKKLNRIHPAQECDARDDNSSDAVG